MPFPRVDHRRFVALSSDARIALERALHEESGLGQVVVVENAGRGVADFLRRVCRSVDEVEPLTFLIGPFGTGATGLVAARHLINAGFDVRLVLAGSAQSLGYAVQMQLGILDRMGVTAIAVGPSGPGFTAREAIARAGVVVDALLGGGLSREPRGRVQQLITELDRCGGDAPIVALDYPSGLCPDTGSVAPEHIRAAATVILGIPVRGVLAASARAVCGQCYLVDIGIPRPHYNGRSDLLSPPFRRSPIIRLEFDGETGEGDPLAGLGRQRPAGESI